MPCPRHFLIALVVACVAFAPCNAQPFTLVDGNVSFTLASLPASPSSTSGLSDFTADAATAPDVLLQHNWLYRLAGDTRESILHDGNGQVVLFFQLQPDLLVVHWPDVDGRGLFSAVWFLQVLSTGPTAGVLVSRLTVINQSASPLTIDVFGYSDVDLCGASGNVATTVNATNTRHRIVNATQCTTSFVEVAGIAADRWEVLRFSQLRNKLLDAAVDTLANTTLPFGPGDYTSAMQWEQRTIQPNGNAAFIAVLGHNHAVCESPATMTNYGTGLAGTNGIPSIGSRRQPVIGSLSNIQVANALPNSVAVIIAGITRSNLQLGNLTILTQSIASGSIPIASDGRASLALQIPNIANLCGATLQFQCLFVDGGVSGAFPVAHTDGLEWKLGGF